jgi:hypothetical protein
VGLLDIPGTVNACELSLLGVATLDTSKVSPEDRALVVAFHTWTATNDAQVLLDMRAGRVFTIDFGDSFSDVSGDPQLVVLDLPGVSSTHGRGHAAAACSKIEALSDHDILSAVAKVPWGDGWGATPELRLQLATRLSARRAKVRGVMGSW